MTLNPLNNLKDSMNMKAIEPNENIPKKTRKPQKDQQPRLTDPLPPEFLKEFDQRLNEIIKDEIKRKEKTYITDYKPLELMVSEYLKSFIIIGYTLTGEKVVIGHAMTQQEHDSIIEHLRHTFMNIIGNMQ